MANRKQSVSALVVKSGLLQCHCHTVEWDKAERAVEAWWQKRSLGLPWRPSWVLPAFSLLSCLQLWTLLWWGQEWLGKELVFLISQSRWELVIKAAIVTPSIWPWEDSRKDKGWRKAGVIDGSDSVLLVIQEDWDLRAHWNLTGK